MPRSLSQQNMLARSRQAHQGVNNGDGVDAGSDSNEEEGVISSDDLYDRTHT